MAAVAPARLDAHTTDIPYIMDTGDLDAEGEDDPEAEYPKEDPPQAEPAGEAEVLNGVASEGSEVAEDDEEEDDDEDELAKPMAKIDMGKQRAQSDELSDEEVEEDEDSSGAEEDGSEKESSEEGSAAREDWEARSDDGSNDAAVSVANRNNCIFCKQDEEHDPSEEFEEYMACSVCGDNSHRQCARGANSLASDDDAEQWRCPQCVDNALEPDNPDEEEAVQRRRRSSASRLTRDLLPAARGTSKPGSHSIFNTLIVDDDPLDGSRSLRKRKATEEQEDSAPVPSKRSRPSSSASKRSVSAAVTDRKVTEEPVVDNNVEASSISSHRSTRPSRARRLKSAHPSPVTITTNDHDSIVVGLKLNPTKLADILSAPPKRKRTVRPSRSKAAMEQRAEVARPLAVRPQHPISSHYTAPFYAFHERENDDLKSKPYGGILSEADAETAKTLPLQADRIKFNEARRKAEEEWKLKTASAEAEFESKGRSSQKLSGPPSKIKCVTIGGFEIETWYAAPYPEEYSRNRVLYICEFCLKYMNSDYVAWRHKLKCPAKHPPGDEIYREKSVSVFEVDGRKNPVYCQNLCLLAKLFLGSKTLYYDVEPFLFYVMTECDDYGCHFVGYFSKEKRPSSQNNVSCILTLPTHQRKGYGNLLISFSYLLTRVEGKTGSPEKPLSDMGLVSYRNYWRLILSYELLDQTKSLSITDLSNRTGMTADDLVAALEGLRALVRDPVTKTYGLRLDRDYLQGCIETWEAKNYVTLNSNSLIWTPYIMSRSNLAHYDHAPALPTIAAREDEDTPIAAEEGVQQSLQQAALINGEAGPPNGIALTSNAQLNGEPPATLTAKESTILLPAPSPTPISSQTSNQPPPETIPAIRYEIFPPLPGSSMRQRNRGGARSGAGRKFKPVAQTPTFRGGRSFGKGDGTASPKTGGRTSRSGTVALQGSERKTRSSLRLGGDGAIDSEHSEEEKESDVEIEIRGRKVRKESPPVIEDEQEGIDEAMAGMEADRQLVGEAGKGPGYPDIDEEKDGDFEAEDAEDEDDDEEAEEEEDD